MNHDRPESRVGRKKPNRKGAGGYKNNKKAQEDAGVETKKGLLHHEDDEIDDMDQCDICAEKIVYAAYTPCNHKTCHKCLLRQRALYEKQGCLVCRTENETVVISEQLHLAFTELIAKDLSLSDDKHKILFTDDESYQGTMALLEMKCGSIGCGKEFASFKSLQDHIKQEHNKYYCLICYNNKKVFISELPMFNYKALQNHQNVGDNKGFKGHPACKHCKNKKFYSEDELNIHIRDSHERCHICDQYFPKIADYYKNYDELYDHFKTEHYVCTIPSCLDKKFVVFKEDLDLTAHMLKEHGSITGANNRIIIGSNGGFNSQLSTFPSSSNNNRRLSHSIEDEPDSYNTKKMRLEERAKHYLNYDNSKLQQFLDLNDKFKTNKLEAQQLVDEYKAMFVNQNPSEFAILLTEFSELFSENNSRRKSLETIIQTHYSRHYFQPQPQPQTKSNKKSTTSTNSNQFPVLGGSNVNPNTFNMHGWGNTNSGSSNSSTDNFPTLSKPNKTPQKNQIINPNQPIRYTTVLKNNQPKKPSPSVSTQSDNSFRPTYLENMSNGSRSSSSSPSSSTTKLNKFPPLEKKETKKKFPRVNQIQTPSPSEWSQLRSEGSSSTSSLPQSEESSSDNRKSKQKKKQILFSNDF